jgi:hypothetical protein
MATKTWIMIAMMLAGVRVPTARAHEGHAHKVIGTVTEVAVDHVTVKTTDGKDVSIQVAKDTKVLRGTQALKMADIKPGVRVVVTAVAQDKQTTAKVIQVGPLARGAVPR